MERVIREFIKQHGKAAFETELRRVLNTPETSELSGCSVERSAFPAEIEKIYAENAGRTAKCPMPDLIHYGGHYLVKSSGEIIFVSAPCALNLEITEGVNDFCRENEWSYEVLPAMEPRDSEMPLRMVFSTGFFVSPT